jgi:hypothetical protein
MYVAPTPFGLLEGIDRQVTLILPADEKVDARFRLVGKIERIEARKVVAKYTFDLHTNDLSTSEGDNPTAGTVHRFRVYRLKSSPRSEVTMKRQPAVPTNDDADTAEDLAERRVRRRPREPRR